MVQTGGWANVNCGCQLLLFKAFLLQIHGYTIVATVKFPLMTAIEFKNKTKRGAVGKGVRGVAEQERQMVGGDGGMERSLVMEEISRVLPAAYYCWSVVYCRSVESTTLACGRFALMSAIECLAGS
ncbi:hypothetical protein BaRGS_00022198 [Batillaria attramentaria]|uniref:Uncharacterized protein n=1 Tax=Batillaria attramentaria TaxID=370345 RepID=A0ABD0KHZ1_9CAEN